MDPVTISTAVVAFLSPYLVEGGKAVAKKAGEALWSAMQKRFAGKPVPETALKDLKDDPEDPDNQAALRKELRKELKADAKFLAQIAKLLEDAKAEAQAAGVQVTVRGSGAAAVGNGAVAAGARGVAVSGNVGGGISTGSGNVTGDTHDDED
jgi:hypothetical protein